MTGRSVVGQRAFTLIEVVVALVVVALGMSALLVALGSSADTATQLRERSFAQWIGFNQLASARLTTVTPTEGTTEGTTEFADQAWQWRQTTEAMEIPGVFRLIVEVRRAPADGEVLDDDAGWIATITGFKGAAGNTPLGNEPDWQGTAFQTAGGRGGGDGQGGGRGGGDGESGGRAGGGGDAPGRGGGPPGDGGPRVPIPDGEEAQ